MRWLVGLLVAANILIFATTQWSSRTPVETVAPERSDPGNLRLLSELDGATEEPSLGRPSDDSQERAVEDAPSPARDRAGSDEMGSGAARRSTGGQDAEPSASPPVQPLPARCGSLGPLTTEDEARALTARLEGAGMEASLESRPARVPSRYVVLVPPSSGGTDADELLARMRTAGLKDVRRLPEGDLGDGISLGAFSTLENAQNRQTEVRDLGFQSRIITDYAEVAAYSVLFRYDNPKKAASIGMLLQENPGLGVQSVACSQIVRD